MSFTELVLIAVGLSMDAFAVSLCKGLSMRKLNIKYGLLLAFFFGAFQAIMPFAGWLICKNFEKYITAFDHWIAFLLLVFIGGKMIVEAVKDKDDESKEVRFDIKEMFLLAIATSIDALAVGITFAFLNVSIYSSVGLIGAITFVISFAGVLIGNRFGVKFKTKAEIVGRAVLVLIGVKILLQHLGVIAF